jgi:hypothetical protein
LWVAVLVATVFFACVFLVLYHQYLGFQVWSQIEDIHHETFVMCFAAFGLGVLIGAVVVAVNSCSISNAPVFCEDFYAFTHDKKI